MLFEPEALATLPRSKSACSSVLGSTFLGLLASLLGIGQSRLSALGLALLGTGLLEVALGVLVHRLGDIEGDPMAQISFLVRQIGHYGLFRRVRTVYPGHVVDSVFDALPAIRGDGVVELSQQRIHVLPVVLNRLTQYLSTRCPVVETVYGRALLRCPPI